MIHRLLGPLLGQWPPLFVPTEYSTTSLLIIPDLPDFYPKVIRRQQQNEIAMTSTWSGGCGPEVSRRIAVRHQITDKQKSKNRAEQGG